MKASNLIAFAIGAGMCAALYACGGGGSSSSGGATPMPPPVPPAALMLSVNDVLGQAKIKSETADPFSIIGGSVTAVNDETSDPMSID
jgi:hypothetical protein